MFYLLCAGASQSEKDRWSLGHAGTFRYLAAGGTLDVEGMDDAEEYHTLRNAMSVLNFSEGEVDDIFRVCSAVLSLGNVDFAIGSKDDARVANPAVLDTVARMLRVDVGQLATALVSQRKKMGRDSILTVRSALQAEASRDALAKKLYACLFEAIIARINTTLGVKAQKSKRIVGILDVFGFEGGALILSHCTLRRLLPFASLLTLDLPFLSLLLLSTLFFSQFST